MLVRDRPSHNKAEKAEGAGRSRKVKWTQTSRTMQIERRCDADHRIGYDAAKRAECAEPIIDVERIGNACERDRQEQDRACRQGDADDRPRAAINY